MDSVEERLDRLQYIIRKVSDEVLSSNSEENWNAWMNALNGTIANLEDYLEACDSSEQ